VVQQLLVEHLILATAAGLAAIALSAGALRWFWQTVTSIGVDPPPYWLQIRMDGRVFTMLAAVCVGTAVMSGLVPALQAAKTNVAGVLSEGGRGHVGNRRSHRWAGILMVTQLALARAAHGCRHDDAKPPDVDDSGSRG
jgi:hypothetical protein